METRDNTSLIFALAVVGVVAWFALKPKTDVEAHLAKCQSEFEGFKNGVIYRK